MSDRARIYNRLLSVCILALVVSTGVASLPAATGGDPTKALARFVGSREVTPDTAESGWRGQMVIKPVAAANGLYGVFASPDKVAGVAYETHTLWGYNYGTEKVHVYELTSTGGATDFAGEFTTTGDLILSAPGVEGTSVERRLSWVSPAEVRVQLIVRSGARSEQTESVVWRKTSRADAPSNNQMQRTRPAQASEPRR